MLHRSFKPAKCKTSLKLASSRLKLLKNRKDGQVKQMKRELAQLLESGQERTARIRVEHLIREEKMMAAYDLLEIYCELIAARLQIIESQKNCPIDLKEAITSVIFASPRCSDVTELQDIRKHITAKYGKEFVAAAVELRPECGVSRLLVEKLSAKAPDGQTKMKILKEIAEEHNIAWDPKSLEEKELKPPEDLLNGPNTFDKVNKMQTAPPSVQIAPSTVQAPQSHYQKYDAPVNFDYNTAASASPANLAPVNIHGHQMTTATRSDYEVRPSGSEHERMRFRPPYSGDEEDFSPGAKNWNMEFEDATAAAQAAAESAEIASRAARAAAELARRGKVSGQYSTESQKSKSSDSGNERRKEDATGYFAKDSGNHSFQGRNSQLQNQLTDEKGNHGPLEAAEGFRRGGHDKNNRPSRSDSLRSNTTSIDERFQNDFQKAERYSRKSSFVEDRPVKAEKSSFHSELSMKKKAGESEVVSISGCHSHSPSENFDYYGEERIKAQASSVSSHSNSSNHGDDDDILNYNRQKLGFDVDRDHQFSVGKENIHTSIHTSTVQTSLHEFSFDADRDHSATVDLGNIHTATAQKSSSDKASVVFDASGSDDDEYRFDMGTKDDVQDYSSVVRESSVHLSAKAPRQSAGEPLSDKASVVFDASGSDDDECRFDTGTKDDVQDYSSVVRESSVHLSANGPRQSAGEPLELDENLNKRSSSPSQPDDLMPVTFNDSEGPSSDSDNEIDKSRFSGSNKSIPPPLENVYIQNVELTRTKKDDLKRSSFSRKGDSGTTKVRLGPDSSSDDCESPNVTIEKYQDTEFGALYEREINFEELPASPSSSRKSKMERTSTYDEKTLQSPESPTAKENDFLAESSLDSGKRLNFGTLRGGFKHHKPRPPPYTKSPSNDVLPPSKEVADNSVSTNAQSYSSPETQISINSGVSKTRNDKSSPGAPITIYESDSDDSDVELPKHSSGSKRESFKLNTGKEVYTRMRLQPTATYFDSDDSDSGEDWSTQAFIRADRAGSGLSRRTKATPKSEAKSHRMGRINAEERATSEASSERIPSRSAHDSKPQPQKPASFHQRTEPSPPKQVAPRPMAESKVPLPKESLSYPEERGSYKAISESIPSRSSHDSKPQPQKPTSFRQRTEPSPPKQVAPKPMAESKVPLPKESLSYPEERGSYEAISESIPSRSSHDSKPQPQKPTSFRQRTKPSPPKQAAPKTMPESKIFSREESLKSSAMETSSSPMKKVEQSGTSENPKKSTGEAPSRESSFKKTTHVHPKLPDYDDIAARLQALRMNRP